MKKAYWIAKYKKINSQEALDKYAERAKKIIESTRWSKGLKHAPDGKIIVETEAAAVGQLNKLLVDNKLNVSSLRSMNSLEAYFLSLTSGNEV